MGHILRQIVKTATATALPVLKEQKAKIGKFNINYAKVGHGSHNVVMIPGTLGSIRTHFKYQINGFNKEKITLVIFEPQGYGKSVPPERILTKDMYQRDADTAYELMKFLNIPKYSVMGWCAGGTASMVLAAQHPDNIKKLVVWNTSSFTHPDDLDTYKRIKELSTWDDNFKQNMIEAYGEETFQRLWKQWVETMVDILKVDPDICSEQLKNITCPTYILYGLKDKIVHPVHFPFLCHHIKNSKYFLYPEGKHDIHMTYPDDFNQKVQEFLLEE